jgi:hypothetical protein
MLDNDFAAVRSDRLTDHVFTGLAISENGLAGGSVPPEGNMSNHTGDRWLTSSAWQLSEFYRHRVKHT